MKYFLIVALALLGCEKTPGQEYEPKLNVFCLLTPGLGWPRASISRTFRIDEIVGSAVLDAEVRLMKDSDAYLFEPVDTMGNYRLKDAIEITNLGRYRFEAASSDYGAAWGQTTVPGAWAIVSPAWLDTFNIEDGLWIVGSVSPAAKGYRFELQGEGTSEQNFFYVDAADLASVVVDDTFYLYWGAFYEAGRYTLKVAALDTNAFLWQRKTESEWGGFSDSSLIHGGFGVFGSMVASSTVFYVTEAPQRVKTDRPNRVASQGGHAGRIAWRPIRKTIQCHVSQVRLQKLDSMDITLP